MKITNVKKKCYQLSPKKTPDLQNEKKGGGTSFYDMKGGIITI
jgi:hypothetical protein